MCVWRRGRPWSASKSRPRPAGLSLACVLCTTQLGYRRPPYICAVRERLHLGACTSARGGDVLLLFLVSPAMKSDCNPWQRRGALLRCKYRCKWFRKSVSSLPGRRRNLARRAGSHSLTLSARKMWTDQLLADFKVAVRLASPAVHRNSEKRDNVKAAHAENCGETRLGAWARLRRGIRCNVEGSARRLLAGEQGIEKRLGHSHTRAGARLCLCAPRSFA